MKTKEKATRVLYIDIDGTVRKGKDELGHFVNKAEDVELFDGVKERLWRYRKAGWRVMGVTNQGGVALGILSAEDVMGNMQRTVMLTGDAFDRMTICMHHPDAKDPEFAVCWCRKPRIGGLVEAALSMARQHHEFYPQHLGLFVGDRPEDEGCAQNAGLPFMSAAAWRESGEP